MSDAQLEILATHAGLAVDWIDANGRAQKVAPAVLRNVLTSLGHPAGTAQEIDASLLELQQVQQTRQLPPLLTVDCGAGLDLSHYFDPETPCEIHLEDGARLNLKLNAEAVLPGLIPVGYQHVEIDGQSFTLAVAPNRCYSVGDAVDNPIPVPGDLACSCTPCVAPAMVASAIPRPWKISCVWPASEVPTPWRSARCTRCSAATLSATARIHPPAACSSTASMPRRVQSWANVRCAQPSTAPAWRRTSSTLKNCR